VCDAISACSFDRFSDVDSETPMRAAELVGQIRDNRGAAGGSDVERPSMGRRCPRAFKTQRST
jgi:hypothetical protein